MSIKVTKVESTEHWFKKTVNNLKENIPNNDEEVIKFYKALYPQSWPAELKDSIMVRIGENPPQTINSLMEGSREDLSNLLSNARWPKGSGIPDSLKLYIKELLRQIQDLINLAEDTPKFIKLPPALVVAPRYESDIASDIALFFGSSKKMHESKLIHDVSSETWIFKGYLYKVEYRNQLGRTM